jgi:polar amino acid transport system permease protein
VPFSGRVAKAATPQKKAPHACKNSICPQEFLMIDLHGFENQLLLGLLTTVKLALSALILGLMIGLSIAAVRVARVPIMNPIAVAYTTLMRGLPELLVVFLVYFGSSRALMALAAPLGYTDYIELSPFIAGTIALALTFSAYASEVFRGAFLAVPIGQWESAAALGLSKSYTFFHIILPQVWRVALPGLGNLFMVLMKDTALVSVIGLEDIMRKAQYAVGESKAPFTFFLAAAVLYLVLTIISMLVITALEKRFNRGFKRTSS